MIPYMIYMLCVISLVLLMIELLKDLGYSFTILYTKPQMAESRNISSPSGSTSYIDAQTDTLDLLNQNITNTTESIRQLKEDIDLLKVQIEERKHDINDSLIAAGQTI